MNFRKFMKFMQIGLARHRPFIRFETVYGRSARKSLICAKRQTAANGA